VKRFILSALFFIALLSIWHLLVLAKVWSPVLLPDPISVWEYLKGAAEDGTLFGWLRHRHCGWLAARAADGPVQVL
jgi:ABC-type nitrate/sulfonate/bicarbonate transport system permease component